MEWLERQAFPQTATGKQLDLHGAQRGVLRKQAEKAAGVVSFSRYLPLSFDLVVPKGTVCATSGEPVVEYATTEEAVLQAGELTVDVPVEQLSQALRATRRPLCDNPGGSTRGYQLRRQ